MVGSWGVGGEGGDEISCHNQQELPNVDEEGGGGGRGGGMYCHSVNELSHHTKLLGPGTSPVGRGTSSSVQ